MAIPPKRSAALAFTVSSEPCGGRQRPRPGGALGFEQIGQQKGEIDRLLGIESRIADGVVAILEIGIGDHARATGALGHILAGHLQMHTTAVSTLGAVNRKERLHFGQDAVERPGLVARLRGDGVADQTTIFPSRCTARIICGN